MDLTTILIPVLAALAGGVAGGWFMRPKTRAEAKKVEAETDDLIVNRLYAEINRLDTQLTGFRELLAKATTESENLCGHLSSAKDEVVRLRELMAKAAEQLDESKPAQAEATLKKAEGKAK